MGHIYRYVTQAPTAREMRAASFCKALERYHLLEENAAERSACSTRATWKRSCTGRLTSVRRSGTHRLWRRRSWGRAGGEPRPRCCCAERAEPAKSWLPRDPHQLTPAVTDPLWGQLRLGGGRSESELFGHERGASLAVVRHPGRFELVMAAPSSWTKSDLPMEVQVKLLRVLQERSFERVGGSETILGFDVRDPATHQDPKRWAAGKFQGRPGTTG